ncbi:MAG: arginine repressor [Eubacteriales bacterium]|nr:arginine repressor [Eubacteriales bacterium]MDD3883213.1 arginine repressor [Eubacteriales bacterium]MDD4512711.1 arginine repressor [Eubacteriales bacterium]
MVGNRRALILELIQEEEIETQEELVSLIRRKGLPATQATISRDIRSLRLVKVLSPASGKYIYAAADKSGESGMNDRFIRMFSESVLSVDSAQNLIVIKTLAGSAHVAGEAIDSLRWEQVMGSIAGDNTLLIIVRDIKDVPDVCRRFREMMK